MDFDAQFSALQGHHGQDRADDLRRLADLAALVDSPDRAARFTWLVNHLVGEEGGDWPAALRMNREALAGPASSPTPVAALGNLAVSAYLAGDMPAAMTAELQAIAASPDDALRVVARARLLVVSALSHAGRWEVCLPLFAAVLEVVEGFQEKSPIDRLVAITCNNLGSALRELPARTAGQDRAMVRAAETARAFWLKAGDWMNDERADYLLALVHNAVGQHARALEAAERGLETIAAHGEEPIDAAFLNLARAEALRGLEQRAAYDGALEAADALGRAFDDAGLRQWYEEERAKVAGARPA